MKLVHVLAALAWLAVVLIQPVVSIVQPDPSENKYLRRQLALARNTASPTLQPTTSAPSTAPTTTGAPVTEALPNNNNNDQAVATLVGSTVPFLGIGGIALGIYMFRRRRGPSMRNGIDPIIVVGASHEQKHQSSKNPGFTGEQSAEVPMTPDAFPTTNLAPPPIPPSIMGIMPSGSEGSEPNRSSKRKTPNSLMAMVLRSRETASFYKSPLDEGGETESGLSKAQIEEKIRRQAAYGARGYGTSTSGVGLKPLGRAISLMRSADVNEKILRPSEVASRASLMPTAFAISSIPTSAPEMPPPPPPSGFDDDDPVPASTSAPAPRVPPKPSVIERVPLVPSVSQTRNSEATKSVASFSALTETARGSLQTARQSVQSVMQSVPSFVPTKYMRKSTMYEAGSSVPSMASASSAPSVPSRPLTTAMPFKPASGAPTSSIRAPKPSTSSISQLDPKNSTTTAGFHASVLPDAAEEKAAESNAPKLEIAKPPAGFMAQLPRLDEDEE